MEAVDAADVIRELREDRAEQEAEERFRSVVALAIAFLATLLAIASLGGGNVGEDMVHANIKASDTWAFFQAKNIRQTSLNLAADEMEATLLIHGNSLSPEAHKNLQEKIERYRATSARYDSEPDPKAPNDSLRGEGKAQLAAQARDWERQRDKARERDVNFDYSEIFFQIAIVLGSVAILALSRPIFITSLALGGVATVLMLNGYFLLFPLPL
ncbi:MAG TPA: DUF4337 domain-containing protein [Longimicrobiaceae bacterium]|nr:DUF4337 domain-containing protein [Longimicrobiaceae bacterium]